MLHFAIEKRKKAAGSKGRVRDYRVQEVPCTPLDYRVQEARSPLYTPLLYRVQKKELKSTKTMKKKNQGHLRLTKHDNVLLQFTTGITTTIVTIQDRCYN